MTTTERDHPIDILKALAAFMIVMLHCTIEPVPRYVLTYEIVTRTLSRCAVPLFFMITGYYIPMIQKSKRRERQYFGKILLITVGTSLFYNFMKIVENGPEYINHIFRLKSLANLLLLNRDPFGLHIWYLHALVYTLLFIKLISSHWGYKTLYRIAAALLAVIIIANICGYGMLVRNFVTGITCVTIGIYIREEGLTISHLKTLTLILCILTIAEGLFFELYVNQMNEIYVTTIPLASCCMCIATKAGRRDCKPLSYIGHRCSTMIYIFHIYFFLLYCRLLDTSITAINLLLPFIVYATTLLFSLLMSFIKITGTTGSVVSR